MGNFVHLHLHSEYSLLDGACRIRDIPERVRECGHDAVALTDHGVLYGAVAFDEACRKAGIHPIIGCEVYVAPSSRFDKTVSDHAYSHLVLLCENQAGYRNLMTLVSAGFTEGFYSRPRIDIGLLRELHGGLIALSGCLSGEIPRRLSAGDFAGAEDMARTLSAIFGPDHFYIELQNHALPEEKQILPHLVRLARKLNLPVVATNDCHYLRKQDAYIQEVLTCIQTNRRIGQDGRVGFSTDEFYYKSTEEMQELFASLPEALENTVRIAERCDVTFDFSACHLPKFPCPDGETAREYLHRLTEDGFHRRIESGDIVFKTDNPSRNEAAYRERLDYELSVIARMGYDDYFLIVQDYVNFAKNHDIPVGPGRGSGAGSLVAFCLGITEVDSIAYKLLFERFLNPERVSMPDIDVDFCYLRRDEVIRYVTEKYGADHVSQIITFGTMAARAAIRDVGRAMDMSYADVDKVARAVPQTLGITIAEALRLPELQALYRSSDEVKKLVDTAAAIEGMPRNASVHAAGVVITDRPVSEFVPLAVCNGTVVTQYDMDTVAKLGILKFDFLALRYLTIMHDAEMQVRETDPAFELRSVPTDDRKTYDMISQGQTLGVFQLESGGIRQLLTGLKPRSIEDIEAAIALYRPGPMESIPTYLACRQDPSKVRYPSPILEDVLSDTYGVTVYQEQVMSIFRVLAGYTYGHADIVRRAMSKKKASVLEAERGDFVKGAVENGMTEENAEKLFDDMGSFANYAFNKSHAAAYALISYRTAYLKAHYPAAYYAALLTSVLGNQGKMAEYITASFREGIAVLPPDINESRMNFRAVTDETGSRIRYGLLALKNVGESFLKAIFAEQDIRPFTSFEDFLNRLSGHDLNKRQVEALIKAGAFDRFPTHRAQLLAVFESMIDTKSARNRANLEGQMDMFSLPDGRDPESESPSFDESGRSFTYPDIPPFSLRKKLMLEKEVSGMFFSGQLLDDFGQCIASLHVSPIARLLPPPDNGENPDAPDDPPPLPDRSPVKIAGIVTSVTVKTTKREERMAFFTLQDSSGEIECLAFPKIFTRYAPELRSDEALFIEGQLSVREEESPKVLVSSLGELVDDAHFPGTVHPSPSADHAGMNPPSDPPPRRETLSGEHTHPSGGNSDNPPRPAGQVAYNPYESMTSVMDRMPVSPPKPSVRPHRLYLRLPDRKGTVFQKAENLAEIFSDPLSAETCFVVFYDESTGTYHPTSYRLRPTPFLLTRLEALLGKPNVVVR